MPKKKKNLALALTGLLARSAWTMAKIPFRRRTKPNIRRFRKEATHFDFRPLETVEGDYQKFVDSLHQRSLIVLIFGKRGSGKSTLGFRLLENLHTQGKPCFVLGVRQELVPRWIKEIESLEEVTNKGVVLVDEGAIAFSARQSMRKENIELGKLLAIARHRDLTLILVTQNTSMIDKSVLNLADVILAKEGSLLQKQMERTAIRNFVTKADALIKKRPSEERVKLVYVFSDDFEGLCEADMPSFWSQKISKSHSEKS